MKVIIDRCDVCPGYKEYVISTDERSLGIVFSPNMRSKADDLLDSIIKELAIHAAMRL